MQMPAPQPYVYASDQQPPPVKNKRALFLIVGAIALIVLVILVVVFVRYQNAKRLRMLAQEAERTEQVLRADEDCETTQDPEKCQAFVQQELAQSNADAMYCEGLDAESYDGCVTLAALAAEDASLCDRVVDEEKRAACTDAALATAPSEERSYALCTEFSDVTVQERCQFQWILEHVKGGDCTSPHVTREQCGFGAVIMMAESAQDPDFCNQITDDRWQGICLELTGPGDRDFDGLTQKEEDRLGTSDTSVDSDADGLSDADELNIWKTDPSKVDSDADGYGDGVEVNSGYNPLGAG